MANDWKEDRSAGGGGVMGCKGQEIVPLDKTFQVFTSMNLGKLTLQIFRKGCLI